MYLTLEIVSANGEALARDRRKVIGPEGAQIGREKGTNEWVLEGKQISRHHARVRYLNGAFYIEGIGKNPLSINDRDNVLPNHEPQVLRAGDTIFIEQYEVRASISRTAPASGPAASAAATSRTLPIPDDPFADPAEPPAMEMSSRSPPEYVDTLAGSGFGSDVSVDPLQLLDGGSPAPPTTPLPPVNLNQGSVLEERLRLPPVLEPELPAAPARSAAGPIPDEWDSSRVRPIERAESVRPAPAPQVPPPSPRAPTPPPAAHVQTSSSQPIPRPGTRGSVGAPSPARGPSAVPPQQSPPNPAATASPVASQAWPASPGATSSAAPPPAWPVNPAATSSAVPPHAWPTHPAAAPSAAAGWPSPPAAPSSGSPAAPGMVNLDLAELLRAAGVNATNISPEAASDLGQVLRIAIEGVMRVLMGLGDIKSEFGMPLTRIRGDENNPLKFSPNLEAALHTMLAERNRAYMPAPRAFEEAFADIRNHQLAVLEGIRTAFRSMLTRFDPEQLQEQFERQSKSGGLLNLGGKSRLWEQYVDHFQALTRDPDESFRRLFGEEFADAYEKQLERLKTTGRHSR